MAFFFYCNEVARARVRASRSSYQASPDCQAAVCVCMCSPKHLASVILVALVTLVAIPTTRGLPRSLGLALGRESFIL